MMKRLAVFFLILMALAGCLTGHAQESFLDPVEYPNSFDCIAKEFNVAFNYLCDMILHLRPNDVKVVEMDSDYGLAIIQGEGLSDVHLLFRLVDLKLLGVGCQIEVSAGQGLANLYMDGVAMGRTFPVALSAMVYLDGDEELSSLQTAMPELKDATQRMMAIMQKAMDAAGSESVFDHSETFDFRGSQVTMSSASNGEEMVTRFVLHAAP